jgi:hypothetical protein
VVAGNADLLVGPASPHMHSAPHMHALLINPIHLQSAAALALLAPRKHPSAGDPCLAVAARRRHAWSSSHRSSVSALLLPRRMSSDRFYGLLNGCLGSHESTAVSIRRPLSLTLNDSCA